MAAWTGGRRAVFLLMVILSVPPATMGAEVGLPLDKLPIVAGDHPRVFFFRQTESFARGKRMPYDDWDACFSRLLGIMGKALDEEIPGTIPDNIDYFTRFKDRHPDQAVLLHYNGNARDPRFERGIVLPSPWLYPVAFDLAAIAPEVRVRRISGTLGQDTETNNGQPIGPTAALPPLDALFLEVAED